MQRNETAPLTQAVRQQIQQNNRAALPVDILQESLEARDEARLAPTYLTQRYGLFGMFASGLMGSGSLIAWLLCSDSLCDGITITTGSASVVLFILSAYAHLYPYDQFCNLAPRIRNSIMQAFYTPTDIDDVVDARITSSPV